VLGDAVNIILSRFPFSSGSYALYWRLVGKGDGGAPDLELILETRRENGEVFERRPIALVEVKTPETLPANIAYAIYQGIKHYVVQVDEHGEVIHSASGLINADAKRMLQQVRVCMDYLRIYHSSSC
jgi:hypothetical protein